jgi:PKD repeat protein
VAGIWTNETRNLTTNGSPAPPGGEGAEMTALGNSASALWAVGGNATTGAIPQTWDYSCVGTDCRWVDQSVTSGGPPTVSGAMPGNSSYGNPMEFGGYSGPGNATSNATWELELPPMQTFAISNLTPEANQTFTVGTAMRGGPDGDAGYSYWTYSDPGRAFDRSMGNSTYSLPYGGRWYVNATAVDRFGFSTAGSFLLHVQLPGVATEVSSNVSDVGVPIEFSASPIGTFQGPLYYTWNFGDQATAGTENASHAYAAPGNYTATVQLLDALDNVATGTVPVTVSPRPSVNITSTTTLTEVDVPVVFDASVRNGTPAFTYLWDFGDGSPTSTEIAPSHAYSTPGNFSLRLTVTDAAGATAVSTRSVHVVTLLSAVASANASTASVGVPILFTVTPDGGIGNDTFTWHFGDQGTGALASQTHTYWAAGNYTAVVWVNDSVGGSVVRQLTLLITPGPSSHPGSSVGPSGSAWLAFVAIELVLAALIVVLFAVGWRRSRPIAGEWVVVGSEDTGTAGPSAADPADGSSRPEPPPTG